MEIFFFSLPFLWMACEDFLFRSIHILHIPVLLITLFIGVKTEIIPFSWPWQLMNLLYLCAIILLLCCYLLLRYRERIRLNEKFLGYGDLAVLALIAGTFETQHYLFFIIITSGSAIFLTLLQQLVLPGREKTIPLITYISLCYIAYIMAFHA